MIKTIRIDESLHEKLLKLKRYKRETFQEVVERLINEKIIKKEEGN